MLPIPKKAVPGFSLAEVLISIGLLAIALFGVMGSIAYGTRHSRSGEELTEAIHLARGILVHIQEASLVDTTEIGETWLTKDSGLNDEDLVRRQLDEAPLGGFEFDLRQLERYHRHITTERASDDPLNHRYRMARVKVEVFWESKQGHRKAELLGLVSHARP